MVTKMVTIKKYRLTWKKAKTQHHLWKRLCINGFRDVGSCFETPHRPHIDPTWGGLRDDGGWMRSEGIRQHGGERLCRSGCWSVQKIFFGFRFFSQKISKKIQVLKSTLIPMWGLCGIYVGSWKQTQHAITPVEIRVSGDDVRSWCFFRIHSISTRV